MLPLLAQVAEDPDLIRPFFSFDFDDILSLTIAATALIALFVTKRSSTRTTTATASHAVEEVVDDSVLGRFQELLDRITKLEVDLAAAKKDLAEALREIKELRRLEEYLQAKLHEKDAEVRKLEKSRAQNLAEIRRLKQALEEARGRIKHLEEVCHRAGLNGDEDEEV